MRRRKFVTALAGAGAVTLAGCSGGSDGNTDGQDGGSTDGGGSTETISLRVGSFTSKDSFVNSRFLYPVWEEKVRNKLDGYELEIDFQGNASIGGPGELYDLASDGVVDIALDLPAYQGGRMTLNTFVALPELWPVGTEQWSGANQALHEMMTPGGDSDILLEEFTNLGVRPLIGATTPPNQLVTDKEPINSMDQLKGLSVRAGSGVKAAIAEAMGMAPTQLTESDIYTAHQQGTVDTDILNIAAVWSYQWYEVMNYITTNLHMGGFNEPWVIGQNSFQSLPSEVQDKFMEAGRETSAEFASNYTAARKEEVYNSDILTTELPIEKSSELYMYETDARDNIKSALSPIIDDWITERENNGVPAEKAISTFQSLQQEYAGN